MLGLRSFHGAPHLLLEKHWWLPAVETSAVRGAISWQLVDFPKTILKACQPWPAFTSIRHHS